VSGGFDDNSDGVSDILVGAPFADSIAGAPADAGEAYVLSILAAGEVENLTVTPALSPPGAAFVEWTPADRAFGYNVYRGLASGLAANGGARTSSMTQLACSSTSDFDSDLMPDFTDIGTPPLDDAFLYLVTGRNLAGEGPLGSAAPIRINDSQCP
jgi:hypothetical protein